MLKCSYCWADTKLLVGEIPVCVACEALNMTRPTEPTIGKIGLIDTSGRELSVICPFCGLNTPRPESKARTSKAACDHCKRRFEVAFDRPDWRMSPCEQCSELSSAYRRALDMQKKAVRKMADALGQDAEVAKRIYEQLRRNTIKASEDFLTHVRKAHPKTQ